MAGYEHMHRATAARQRNLQYDETPLGPDYSPPVERLPPHHGFKEPVPLPVDPVQNDEALPRAHYDNPAPAPEKPADTILGIPLPPLNPPSEGGPPAL